MKQVIHFRRDRSVVALHNVFAGPAFTWSSCGSRARTRPEAGAFWDTSSHSVGPLPLPHRRIVEQHAVMSRHFGESDVEDAGILCVKAANGALGSLSSSFVYGDWMAFIDIVGTKGRLNYAKTSGTRCG